MKNGKARRDAISKHQQFKIFLLALSCGFRRAEIDSLQWEQLDFERNQIHLYENEHTRLKSETSQRTVDVDPMVMELFSNWRESESGVFVVRSDIGFSGKSHATFYRCQKHFKCLILWLRRNGIESQKPLHELRKEYGSLVCMKYGLFEASSALGHSSIQITAASYLDRKVNTAIRLFESRMAWEGRDSE